MGLFLDAPVPLADAITFVQSQPVPSNNLFTSAFPTRLFDTDEIDWSTITTTNRVVKYRNWDGAFAPVPRDTATERRTKLIPFGGFLETGEWERRQIEHAATAGTNIQRIVDAIYNDLENLTRYAYNRVELAWGDVLTDGILTINENGVVQALDYGLPGGQNVTPVGALWSNTSTSVPFTDLLTWSDAYAAIPGNGVPPGQFKTSLEVLRLLTRNTQLINLIKGANTGATAVSIPEINALLAGYGIPGFEMPGPGQVGGSVYNSSFDVDGVTQRVIGNNKLLFLPTDLGSLGFTAWGVPTTAYELNPTVTQVNVAPGMVGITVREDNPPFRKHVYVDAVALPVLSDPRKLLVATVT